MTKMREESGESARFDSAESLAMESLLEALAQREGSSADAGVLERVALSSARVAREASAEAVRPTGEALDRLAARDRSAMPADLPGRAARAGAAAARRRAAAGQAGSGGAGVHAAGRRGVLRRLALPLGGLSAAAALVLSAVLLRDGTGVAETPAGAGGGDGHVVAISVDDELESLFGGEGWSVGEALEDLSATRALVDEFEVGGSLPEGLDGVLEGDAL